MDKLDKPQLDPAARADLNRLLDQVLDVPPADRERWLADLAPSFAHLKPHLIDLLGRAGAVETADFLSSLPHFELSDSSESMHAGANGDRAGEIVGPYRLLRELGHGGMGSVWLAERTDGLLARAIALKLPHGHWRAVGLSERMAREREILGTLDHRNIAKLLDAGISAQGQPYLAIEYVEGIPIDVYCAGQGQPPPSLRTRLQLFQQAADAVAYAHGKLVIHRDLKPANILVTSDREVRLLDFGIAKLLEHGEARETRLTELSGRALTLDYASPEQILGLPLTVASDVYSLGVILYELLVGARPYRLERDSRGALEDAIVKVEPRRPSEAAPLESRKALRGDLDTIVLKALKKNPVERYATVNAFAEDVARYLDDRPVLAQPDSRLYRFRKFIVRNKLAAGASAAVLGAVIVGATIAVSQMLEADAQRRAAQLHQQRAENVKALLVDVFQEADLDFTGGKHLSAQELLQRAAARIENAAVDDPLVRLEVLRVLGSTLLSVQDIGAAERVVELARTTAGQLSPQHPEVLRTRLLHAELLRYRGLIKDWRDEIQAILPSIESARSQMQTEYTHALIGLAHLETDAHQYDRAIAWAEKALAATSSSYAGSATDRAEALQVLSMAHVYAANSRPEHREPATRFATLARDASLAATDGNARHPLVVDSRMNLARAFAINGQLSASIREWQLAAAEGSAVWGENAHTMGYVFENLSEALRLAGRVSEAVDTASKALEIARQMQESPEERTFILFSRSQTLGVAFFQARRPRDCLAAFEPLANAPTPDGIPARRMLTVRAYHALCLAEVGSLPHATALAEQILREYASLSEQRHQPLYAAGRIARLAGDPARADRILTSAFEPGISYAYPTYRADTLAEHGLVKLALHDLVAARRSLEEAESIYAAVPTTMAPIRADALMALSRIRHQQREHAPALALAVQVDEFWRQYMPRSEDARRSAQWLAKLRSGPQGY